MKFEFPTLFVTHEDTPDIIFWKVLGSFSAGMGALLVEAQESIPFVFVFTMSAALGALGGLSAALRHFQKHDAWSWKGLAVHVCNMGVFGLAFSLVAVWWLQPMENKTAYFICGMAGFAGLIGLPIIEPLANLFQKFMDKFFGELPGGK